MELERLTAPHDRVARVVAALEAHDRVGLLREQVGDLPFSFVAPLGADYHDSRHATVSVGGRRSLVRERPLASVAYGPDRGHAERTSMRRSCPSSGSSLHISVRRETVRSVI